MPSLEWPKDFLSIEGPGPGPQGPKIKIFKTWEKHPQGFTQALNVSSLRQIGPFKPYVECCEGFPPI